MIHLVPLITEKTLALQEQGKHVVLVDLKATKDQIAQAFFAIFKVKPLSVNTAKIKGKVKTDWRKRTPITKSDIKKAIITVDKKTKIDLLSLKKDKKDKK